MEITEEDITEMQKGIKAIKSKVSDLDLDNIASKKDVQLCIGAECEKLSGSILDVKKGQDELTGRVDHIDELVHKQAKQFRPSIETHAKARKAAQEGDDKHKHKNLPDMVECPECYPELKKAIEPKLQAEGYRKEAVKLSEAAMKKLRSRGIPICTDCGVPWLPDQEGKVEEKCVNCGKGQND